MTKKKVWRYYCQYCKKSGCSGGIIAKHEGSCTNNPSRKCAACKLAQLEQRPMPDLVAAIRDGIEKCKEVAEGCPMCILSAIRQSKLQDKNVNEVPVWIDWDFQKARQEFFDIHNDAQNIGASCW